MENSFPNKLLAKQDDNLMPHFQTNERIVDFSDNFTERLAKSNVSKIVPQIQYFLLLV